MFNVGKFMLYNVLMNCVILVENFLFCMIESNSTRVNVSDARFDWFVE